MKHLQKKMAHFFNDSKWNHGQMIWWFFTLLDYCSMHWTRASIQNSTFWLSLCLRTTIFLHLKLSNLLLILFCNELQSITNHNMRSLDCIIYIYVFFIFILVSAWFFNLKIQVRMPTKPWFQVHILKRKYFNHKTIELYIQVESVCLLLEISIFCERANRVLEGDEVSKNTMTQLFNLVQNF